MMMRSVSFASVSILNSCSRDSIFQAAIYSDKDFLKVLEDIDNECPWTMEATMSSASVKADYTGCDTTDAFGSTCSSLSGEGAELSQSLTFGQPSHVSLRN